jgi:hypothetical protein
MRLLRLLRLRGPGAALVTGCLAAGGCAPLDVQTALDVTQITTGWLDVGLDDLGRNKIVPTISFRLQNVSEARMRTLQLNGVFRRCLEPTPGQEPAGSEVSPADLEAGTCAGEVQEWGSALVRAVGREGVEPGDAVGPFTMESHLGYTGQQPRDEMLRHRDFVDVKVELFVKHRAEQWAKLGEFQIARQLLTQAGTS